MAEPMFDGATIEPRLDDTRLMTALERVVAATRNGDWFTLKRLAFEARCSESGASARLRDLRKPKHGDRYGVIEVQSERRQGGLWLYRVIYK